MSDPLLIPATPALLEAWTGPVVRPTDTPPVVRVLVCVDGVVYDGDTESPGPVYLDMRRSEARDRVARVVARMRWQQVGSTAPMWAAMAGLGGWGMRGAVDTSWYDAPFDPNNNARLEDGSRRVDALALAVVAREVLDG